MFEKKMYQLIFCTIFIPSLVFAASPKKTPLRKALNLSLKSLKYVKIKDAKRALSNYKRLSIKVSPTEYSKINANHISYFGGRHPHSRNMYDWAPVGKVGKLKFGKGDFSHLEFQEINFSAQAGGGIREAINHVIYNEHLIWLMQQHFSKTVGLSFKPKVLGEKEPTLENIIGLDSAKGTSQLDTIVFKGNHKHAKEFSILIDDVDLTLAGGNLTFHFGDKSLTANYHDRFNFIDSRLKDSPIAHFTHNFLNGVVYNMAPSEHEKFK